MGMKRKRRFNYNWRKHRRRLLEDDGVDNEHKRIIARVLAYQDKELKREEEDIKRRGFCPICYTVLATTGLCMNTNRCKGRLK